MARITAGQFKGRLLDIPKHIRATEAKVRQALFNILGAAILHARVVDGFAGSGALGLEALSRGAEFVAFIESDADAIISIKDNLERFEADLADDSWRLIQFDMERALPQLARLEPPFDIMIFDPPYNTDDGKKALNSVVEYAMLAPAGIAVIEHNRRTDVPETVGFLRKIKQHRYGDTVLSFYHTNA